MTQEEIVRMQSKMFELIFKQLYDLRLCIGAELVKVSAELGKNLSEYAERLKTQKETEEDAKNH